MEDTTEKHLIGTVSFWTTGEGLTNIIRDMWSSNLVNQALMICTDGGIDAAQGIDLCTGKLKLEGDTREGDHTLRVVPDDTPTYFTVEKQIEQLEEKFVYYTDNVSFLQRSMELGKLPTGRAASYRKDGSGFSQYAEDEETLKKVLLKSKEALAGLATLYPFVGKTLLDIPINKLGSRFTEIEAIESERAWAVVHEHVAQRRYREDDEIDKILQVEHERPKWPGILDTPRLLSFHHGWLAPNGDFYGCQYAGHAQLAADIEEAKIIPESQDPAKLMDSLGWTKLQDSKFCLVADRLILPTHVQVEMIIDYCTQKHDGKIFYNFRSFGDEEEFMEYLEEERGYM